MVIINFIIKASLRWSVYRLWNEFHEKTCIKNDNECKILYITWLFRAHGLAPWHMFN